jgi:hypothetical protein
LPRKLGRKLNKRLLRLKGRESRLKRRPRESKKSRNAKGKELLLREKPRD